MHYKNGKPAKVGDIIVGRDCTGNVFSGIVVKTNTQSDTCNVVVQAIRPGDQVWLTAGDCLPAEDALPIAPPPVAAAS